MAQILTYVREIYVDIIQGDGIHHIFVIDWRNPEYSTLGFAQSIRSGELVLPEHWYVTLPHKEELRRIRECKGEYEAEKARNTYEILAPHDLNNFVCRGRYYAGIGLVELYTRYQIRIDENTTNTLTIILYDRKTGNHMEMGECEKGDLNALLPMTQKAEDYLQEHYPAWKNPLAYWNEMKS